MDYYTVRSFNGKNVEVFTTGNHTFTGILHFNDQEAKLTIKPNSELCKKCFKLVEIDYNQVVAICELFPVIQ